MMNFLLNSRISWAGVAFALAMGWHYTDKIQAVRSAEKELADLTLIESLKSQIAETERREKIALLANKSLLSKVFAAEQSALQAEKELEEYVKENPENTDPFVSRTLHNKLRYK